MEEAKATISNLLLDKNASLVQTEFSLTCIKQGEVCGHVITLVELPALYNTHLSEEEVLRLTLHCVSVCDSGVHAFLFIIPQGPLTDEHKAELEIFQTIFDSRVNDHTIVFINQQSQREQLHESLHSVIKACGGRFGFYSSRTDAVELITHVKDLLKENSSHLYTMDMYTHAQIQTQLKYKKEKEYLQQQMTELKIGNQTQDSLMPPYTLRIVLLGKTGVGKSASGNTILGKEVFNEDIWDESVTHLCQKEMAEISRRQIFVVETPGLFDTNIDNDEIKKEIINCISMAAPGPHVFLLVLRIGQRFTQEEREAVSIIKKTFGKKSNMYTIVLFTGGDMLKGKTAEQYVEQAGPKLKKVLLEFGNRYHVFNNSDKSSNTQVLTLLDKIDSMVKVNGGSCYTNEMFKDVEKALEENKERILKEREEQIKREKEELKKKHEAEMEDMRREMQRQKERQEAEERRKEKEFKEREEGIKREMAEREKQLREDFRRRKEEDDLKIKEQMQYINREKEENQKQWKRQREEDQKQRDQEEERVLKEKEIKEKEEQEKKILENDFNEKIRKMEEQLKVQREEDERERNKKYKEHRKEMVEKLHKQEEFKKEKGEEKRKHNEEMERNLAFLRDQHNRELEKLKRETEEAARKQAEKDFTAQLNKKVKEAKETTWKQAEKQFTAQMEEKVKEAEETTRKQAEKQFTAQMEEKVKEAEETTRKQAEKQFTAELDKKVKEAEERGFKKGCEKIMSERTKLGRSIDGFCNLFQ